MSTGFSAGSQALGYLYQARYALYLVLTNKEELELAVESLDDITFFEDENNPLELLQLKHHTNTQASLTDSSSDLWKTIRVWSTQLQENKISLPDTLLTLVTTAEASANSAAFLLRPVKARDSKRAWQKLLEVVNKSDSKSLTKSFEAFKALNSIQQKQLIDSIQIIDSSPDIIDIIPKIKEKLIAVRREHRDAVYERLEGWWFAKVVKHLRDNSVNFISGFEVRDKICEINDQFKPDALPIDFFDLEIPNQPEISQDNRHFVAQLKEIAVQNKRIEKAILDYYRAFEQRSRWAREELLFGGEIEQYEKRLIDEWERYMLALQDEMPKSDDEDECKKVGRKVFNWMEQNADIRIRSQVTEAYVMRGSYHILADQNPPRVHWHPKFVERLSQLLATT
ncbi:ABC-three component system protein [Calothrix sp. UHCC 0171]|uniref:ABC-three component system protein n=1 Tax=Calothrix sp. UHCC 0171 TaxID=3110245 RepID=UPI002B1F22AC|nr:ABC-three component system protein [Calothrix sp. UHCC 0171]MEA5573495.1 ABC-three component system protein [Calothrix sp. UHCC 0171]